MSDPAPSSALLDLSDARAMVLSRVEALPPIELERSECRGRVIAERVLARENIPSFENSSMDGFALRASDTSTGRVRLRVMESILAGATSRLTLQPGEAVRIMTGAPLPAGADAVCMKEEAELNGEYVTITRVLHPGDYVRHVGSDTRLGDELFTPGDVVSASGIGVLAGQGLTRVRAYPRPRVGVLSTGDEVVDDGSPLRPGQIRDLNRPMLMALVEESGCEAVDLGIARDSRDDVRAALDAAASECDVVVTTGGVSVGDVDYVKVVLAELSPESALSLKVAMKPGKPFAFAVLGPRRVPVFGLPGNPVSTRVSFEMFVRPALRRRGGHRHLERLHLDAVLDTPLERERDGKTHLIHVDVGWGDDGRLHILDAARRESHLLHAVSRSNALAIVPDSSRREAGSSVRVIVLDAESLGAVG